MYDTFFAQRGKPKKDHGARPWDITVSTSAQEGYENQGHFIEFINGSRYIGVAGQPNFQTIQFDQYGIRLTHEISTHSGWPSNASTASLWPQRHNPKVAAELHWRMAMPVSVIVLALLALPMSKVNPRRGKFGQLLPAILLYIVYGNLLFLGRNWVRKGVIGFDIGMWWVHGIMLFIAIGLLIYRRVKIT